MVELHLDEGFDFTLVIFLFKYKKNEKQFSEEPCSWDDTEGAQNSFLLAEKALCVQVTECWLTLIQAERR